MENDNVTQEVEANYLEQIKALKENSVSKEKYDKLVEEHKNLLADYVNGVQPEAPETVESIDIDKLRNDLFNGEHTNLEYCTMAVQLRDEIMARGGRDPFLPNGPQYRDNAYDMEAAENVANVFKECIEYANGNNEIFTQELMRRTKK